MYRTTVAALIVLSSVSVFAQTTSASDPVSGTWTGELGQSGKTRAQITLELKYDGTNITGTVTGPPNPGEIRAGTFDSKTGALKFQVFIQDGNNAAAGFDGTLVDGIATGRVNIGSETGHFRIAKSSAAPASAAAGDRGALRFGFEEVNGWIAKAAESVPADKSRTAPPRQSGPSVSWSLTSPTRTVTTVAARPGATSNGPTRSRRGMPTRPRSSRS